MELNEFLKLYSSESNKYVVDTNTGMVGILEEDEIEVVRSRGISGLADMLGVTCWHQGCSTLPGVLTFTFETTSRCNLACKYCYQADRNTRSQMSDEVISASVQYVINSIKEYEAVAVKINFIGGETLLGAKQLLKLYHGIYKKIDIPIFVHIDSNGCIPMGKVVEAIDHLEVNICLSLPDDHNLLRYSSGRDTTMRILKNISQSDWSGDRHVVIAYNTHGGNLGQFDKFLDWLEPYRFNPIEGVMLSRIDNYSYNPLFENTLTTHDFSVWAGTEGLRSLVRHGWPVDDVFSYSEIELCQGHQAYSAKIYSDGGMTICDAMGRGESRVNVCEIAETPRVFNEVFADIKSVDPLRSSKCVNCPALALCGGDKWCYHGECDDAEYVRHVASVDTMMSLRYSALPWGQDGDDRS